MNALHLMKLDTAKQRLTAAKQQWTQAAQAALRGDQDAQVKADAALHELEAARTSLARLSDIPEPQGEWLIASQISQEKGNRSGR